MRESTMKNLNNLCENYKIAEEQLRYDGNKINNYASVIYCTQNNKIDYELIKTIRKYVTKNTPWFSSFRGDSLNILSILLSTEECWKDCFDDIKNWELKLKDKGLTESAYLAISSWVLSKKVKNVNKQTIVDKILELYLFMKDNYNNITSTEDYLVCVFLALTDIKVTDYKEVLDKVLLEAKQKEFTTNNGAQSIANVLCNDISNYKENINKVEKIINKCKGIGYSIPIHYIAVPALASLYIDDGEKFVDDVKEASDYLKQFDQYTFYMDKSFRFILAMVVLLDYYKVDNVLLHSILALCIIYELDGQAKSLLNCSSS